MLTSPYERKNYKQKSFYVLLSCLWVNVSRYAYRCLGTDARSLLRILASDSISAITPKGNIGKKGKDKAVPIPIPERLPEPTTKAAGDSIPLRTPRKRKRLLPLPSRKKVDLIEFHININEVLYSKRFAGFKRLHVSLVCLLFFFRFIVPLENIFHSYGDVSITSEGLQILTFARHVWPLSSEGSFTCHTFKYLGKGSRSMPGSCAIHVCNGISSWFALGSFL